MTIDIRKTQNGSAKNGSASEVAPATAVADLDSMDIFHGCPHFALIDDPATKILFPSPAGACHHVQQSASVDLDHQQSYCLNQNHVACSVFQQSNPRILPDDIRIVMPGQASRNLLKIVLTIIVLAVLISASAYFFLGGFGDNDNNDGVQANNDDMPVAAAASLIEETATPEPTVTNTVNTATPLPAKTSTIIPTDTPEPESTVTSMPASTAEPTATDMLESTNTPIPTATAVPLPQAVVNVSRLNIRGGPSTDYPIIAIVEENQALDIVGQLDAGGWWQICCVNEGEIGWVLAATVNVEGDTTNVPQAILPPLP